MSRDAEAGGVLMDPENIRCGRVEGHEFKDGQDRIRIVYEITFDGKPTDIVVYSPLDDFASFVVALLNGFGFPSGDLDYVAERLMTTLNAEAAATAKTRESNGT